MQEHIRRAHPEYYIPKLPATKESFELMVNSPPHEIVPQQQQDHWSPPSERREQHYLQHNGPSDSTGLSSAPVYDAYDFQSSFGEGVGQIQNDGYYGNNMSAYEIPRTSGEYRRGSLLPAASAAAALAQLHYARPDGEWPNEHVGYNSMVHASALNPLQNFFSDQVQDITDGKRTHFADPTLSAEQQFLDNNLQYSSNNNDQSSQLLPSSLDKSPPGRSNTLPPMQRSVSRGSRPRKSSVTQHARKARHERKTSKDYLRPTSHDRKAYSAEPTSAAALYGKRWEDLIDAATSATEEDSRDLTPVRYYTSMLGDCLTVSTRYPSHLSNLLQTNPELLSHHLHLARNSSPIPPRRFNRHSPHHQPRTIRLWTCNHSPASKNHLQSTQPRAAQTSTSCPLTTPSRLQAIAVPCLATQSRSTVPAVVV